MRKYSLGIVIIVLLLLLSMRNNKYKYWSYYIRRKWIVFWRQTIRSVKRAISSYREQNQMMEETDNNHDEEGGKMS
ncbi:hypothetical protein ACGTN9_10390 [Halobacillus sp. MO56]